MVRMYIHEFAYLVPRCHPLTKLCHRFTTEYLHETLYVERTPIKCIESIVLSHISILRARYDQEQERTQTRIIKSRDESEAAATTGNPQLS